eukprot:4490295-Amphidinium_carterae.1
MSCGLDFNTYGCFSSRCSLKSKESRLAASTVRSLDKIPVHATLWLGWGLEGLAALHRVCDHACIRCSHHAPMRLSESAGVTDVRCSHKETPF